MMTRLRSIMVGLLGKRPTQNEQMDSLDGLRGLAVLYVIFSHLGSTGRHPVPGIDFGGSGKYGVYLFFVLSAFLLSLPFFVKDPRSFTSRFWANYVSRRFLRVFPLFAIVLFASFLLTNAGVPLPYSIGGRELIAHLFLQEGKSVLWSIPVEFKYYAVLPVVALGIALLLRKRLLPSVFLTFLLVVGAGALWPADASPNSTVNLGYYLPIFVLATFAALVHTKLRFASLGRTARWFLEILGIGCVLASLALVPSVWGTLTGSPVPNSAFHRTFALHGALWSLFVICNLHGVGLLRRALSWAPLRLLGIVSFSVYLLHMPILRVAGPFGNAIGVPSLLQAWAIIGISFGLSIVTYMTIERPFFSIKPFPVRRAAAPSD